MREPGTAIVALFSVSDGICVATRFAEAGTVRGHARLISWPRAEWRALLADWAAWTGAEARSISSLGDTLRGSGAVDSSRFRKVIDAFKERVFEPIAEMLSDCRQRDCLIVPQGELTVLPFWGLLDLLGPQRAIAIAVAPSVALYRLCAQRRREMRGPTLLIPDATDSLKFAGRELDSVRAPEAQAGNA